MKVELDIDLALEKSLRQSGVTGMGSMGLYIFGLAIVLWAITLWLYVMAFIRERDTTYGNVANEHLVRKLGWTVIGCHIGALLVGGLDAWKTGGKNWPLQTLAISLVLIPYLLNLRLMHIPDVEYNRDTSYSYDRPEGWRFAAFITGTVANAMAFSVLLEHFHRK